MEYMYMCVLPDFNLKKVYEIVCLLIDTTLSSQVGEIYAGGVQGSGAGCKGQFIQVSSCLSARSLPSSLVLRLLDAAPRPPHASIHASAFHSVCSASLW